MRAGANHHTLSTTGKALRLAALAVVRPIEFADRVRGLFEIALGKRGPASVNRYNPETWDAWAARAAELLDVTTPWSDDEPGFAAARERIVRRMHDLGPTRFSHVLHADPMLARLAYFLTLALRPAVVVETGVALGVTSSFVLAALDRIGDGRLVSIDRPPLGVPESEIGSLIPDEFRRRWTLHVGTSTRVLRRVLPHLPPIGLFIQDSLFTERNVRAEYDLVLPRLAPRAAVLANAADRTGAFARLASDTNAAASATLRAEGKNELIGVSVYRARSAAGVATGVVSTPLSAL